VSYTTTGRGFLDIHCIILSSFVLFSCINLALRLLSVATGTRYKANRANQQPHYDTQVS